jgi:hypothetical protein
MFLVRFSYGILAEKKPMKQMMSREMKKLTKQDWQKLGTELFGDRWSKWKFQCVKCGHIQSGEDFKALGMEPNEIQKYIGFSCIGRFNKKVGCDWTLGGLFTIHTAEVDGQPIFEFFVLEGKS